jgi:hypothetical protein
MGANAQIAVPAFTAGQVLTATQQTQINTGIPVFATTTTRDAAFGGTGEKVLAQGQYAYIEATSALQVYTGSAWTNAISSGLNLIKTQAIGSAVASVEVTGAFSATYDNYFVTINGGVSSTNNNIRLTLGATATGYKYNLVYAPFGGSIAIETTTTGTFLSSAAGGSTTTLQGNFFLQSPFLTQITPYRSQYLTASEGGAVEGLLNNTTSYTAFTLTASTGTMTGGTIRVYGYQNS